MQTVRMIFPLVEGKVVCFNEDRKRPKIIFDTKKSIENPNRSKGVQPYETGVEQGEDIKHPLPTTHLSSHAPNTTIC